ncbi:VOC family protein [Sanguibacter antarcticus]|uniref:VOC family protein n=1 Tax=Sanguibacter antarcticus TaxID=372484 RepID=UPI001FE3A0BB|nr:VOC family protein [Sanguibacter antarcticus]
MRRYPSEDSISLQVRDLPASAAFYEKHLGFARQAGPPHAVVFDTTPAAFAVRAPLPGVDLDAVPQLGLGVGVWLHAPDAQGVHDALVADGVPITSAPVDGPFGRTFTFADPDGYQITLHSRA